MTDDRVGDDWIGDDWIGDDRVGDGRVGNDGEDGDRVGDDLIDGDQAYHNRTAESVVVTKTVRLLSPFVFVFGLYTMFHGTKTVGGGFQGGVVVASVVVAIAFAFGVDQVREWVDRSLLGVAAAAGVLAFAVVAVLSLAYGGSLFEVGAYPGETGTLYAVEVVEVGIGVTVAATVVILFLELSGGFDGGGDAG